MTAYYWTSCSQKKTVTRGRTKHITYLQQKVITTDNNGVFLAVNNQDKEATESGDHHTGVGGGEKTSY